MKTNTNVGADAPKSQKTAMTDAEANMWLDLPFEVWCSICERINEVKDIAALICTCKTLTSLSCDYVWEKYARKHVPGLCEYKPIQASWQWLCFASERPLEYISDMIIYASANTFDGKKLNGVAIVHVCPDNTVMSGDFKNGILEGIGSCFWNNGNIYRGDWISGKREGHGTFVWNGGDTYTGHWVNNKMHGTGKYIWTTGEYYKGNFKNNKMDISKNTPPPA